MNLKFSFLFLFLFVQNVDYVFSQKNNVFETVTSIPRFNARLKETSISGFSSGSSFSNQFHIAYSSFIKGAGLAAGGQYACIKKHPTFLNCFEPLPIILPIHASRARDQVVEDAAAGKIDPIDNIRSQKLIVISGKHDAIVDEEVQEKQFDSLKLIINAAPGPNDYSNLKFVKKNDFGHNFYTDIPSTLINPGRTPFGTCKFGLPPNIAFCGYDAAGDILQHIYGSLVPRNDNINRNGKFLKFPQSELHPSPSDIGLSEYGYIYVPQTCWESTTECRIHVVLHGCLQSKDSITIDKEFVTETGYAEWADTNKLVLAFPQTTPRLFGDKDFGNNVTLPNIDLSKINACWDMFGLYDREYYNKNGRQMQAIRTLIDKMVRIQDTM